MAARGHRATRQIAMHLDVPLETAAALLRDQELRGENVGYSQN